MPKRTGQRGNVYQARDLGKWNPKATAYGRFWSEVAGGGRKRTTISLGPCAARWVARQRLREYIERADVNPNQAFHANPVPGTTFRQQTEWWMESVSVSRRRPLKPATIFGWQHCLDRWILPHLGSKLLCEVGNREVRQFVEVLSAAGLAPKTIVNVVAVVKLVVASAVDEEGDQLYPRAWNHEFIQLPLVIKEKQNRPTITGAEISAVIRSVKERYVVLLALVAGTGLRIGEALAVRADDFDPSCRVLHIQRSVWRRREQAPKTANAVRLVDLPESLARVLCRYTEGRDGLGSVADFTPFAAFVLRYSERRECRTI